MQYEKLVTVNLKAEMINGIFLLLGGNLGDIANTFEEVKRALISSNVGIVKSSSLYKTAAWGKTDQPDFLNQVLEIKTSLEPDALLTLILNIEQQAGRTRKEKWAPRIIDIDILYYHQNIIRQPYLQIPHPEIENRRFVLLPLCEIAGNFIHPENKKSQQWLLAHCKDNLPVIKLA
jgi:2-amino-4-hydroxy-6-hydroxymethyldihydropteridine diphosphokinase